jgi:nucleotide-binding universal stress UspA family protein
MPKKILLAVDGSERCKEAIASLGRILGAQPGWNILLYHCVPKMGVDYMSDLVNVVHMYHVASDVEEQAGKAVLEASRSVLLESGFPEDAVQVRLNLDSNDPAEDIVAEAERSGISTIVLGRRGLGRMESLFIGSVSGKVAQYSRHLTVWIVDPPLHVSQKTLVAVQGIAGGSMLSRYASEVAKSLPYSQYTFLHLVPPLPAPFREETPRLSDGKERDRETQMDKLQAIYRQPFEELVAEARKSFVRCGIAPGDVHLRVETTKEGIARDLLAEIAREEYQMIIIGKKSLQKKTPFLLGSLANKLLHNARGVILCMVGSE